MNIFPIPFRTNMVQAILADRKNLTRRIISQSNSDSTALLKDLDFMDVVHETWQRPYEYLKVKKNDGTRHRVFCKYCPQQEDVILYVRETFASVNTVEPSGPESFLYKADFKEADKHLIDWKWTSSRFMPKIAARIFLKVTGIRCERLNTISEEDAIAEGVEELNMSRQQQLENGKRRYRDYMSKEKVQTPLTAISSFMSLWESINGKDSWNINPWVWVVEFERTAKPDGFRV